MVKPRFVEPKFWVRFPVAAQIYKNPERGFSCIWAAKRVTLSHSRPGIESRNDVALPQVRQGRERHIFKERSDYKNSRLLTELPSSRPKENISKRSLYSGDFLVLA